VSYEIDSHEEGPQFNSKENIVLEEIVEEKTKRQQWGLHEGVEDPAYLIAPQKQ